MPSRRTVLATGGLATLAAVVLAACGKSNDTQAASGPKKPTVRVEFTPSLTDEAAPNPTAKVEVKAVDGVLNPDVKLLNPSGKAIAGTMSDDRTTFMVTEPLGYGTTYTWQGSATGFDRMSGPVEGKFTTLDPKTQLNVVVNIADGQEVGIAAPLILKFDGTVDNKEAVEKALTLTTEPPTCLLYTSDAADE